MKITKSRIRSLKATLLTSSAHRYPYTDEAERQTFQDAGLLDKEARITLAGAMLVFQHVAACEIPWLALEETERVMNEIKVTFPDQLKV